MFIGNAMHDPAISMLVICLLFGAVILFSLLVSKRQARLDDVVRVSSVAVILRSLLATLVGLAMGVVWYAFYLLAFDRPSAQDLAKPAAAGGLARDLMFHAYAAGLFVALVWLFVLMPIALRVPRTSKLWRLSNCTVFGGCDRCASHDYLFPTDWRNNRAVCTVVFCY